MVLDDVGYLRGVGMEDVGFSLNLLTKAQYVLSNNVGRRWTNTLASFEPALCRRSQALLCFVKGFCIL